jgi:hypothetical protein
LLSADAVYGLSTLESHNEENIVDFQTMRHRIGSAEKPIDRRTKGYILEVRFMPWVTAELRGKE